MTRDQLLADLRRALEPQIADEMEAWIPTDDDRPYGIARSDTGSLLKTVRESVTSAFPDRADRILAAIDARAGFYLSLAETIQWCSLVIDERRLAASLRTPKLWPRPTVPIDTFLNMRDEDRDGIVRGVIQERRARLKHYPLVRGSRGSGRLLVWSDTSTLDGAPEAESEGFFDIQDLPPWDTWVSVVRHGDPRSEALYTHIIAWVPPIALEAALHGINASPTHSMWFLGSNPEDVADVPTGAWKLDS